MKARHLLTEVEMDVRIEEMAKGIIGDQQNGDDLILLGIKTRGVPLAEWLGKKIKKISGKAPKVGMLDINLYRDDLSEVDEQPVVNKAKLPFSIVGKGVVLADDVLYTGRTIRAALDAVTDLGRPKFVRLAVMIDRGWRELPIHADYVGEKVKTTATQNVKVRFAETDGANEVLVKG